VSFAAIVPAALAGGWVSSALGPTVLFAVVGLLQALAWAALLVARGDRASGEPRALQEQPLSTA